MLTVQSSSGLYNAVQYDGTNGQAIATALQALDYRAVAGAIEFKAFIMRAGGLLTSGHQFRVPLGHWVVWAEEGNPYVIAPPLTEAEFGQQYQTTVSPAEIAALVDDVAALSVQVTALTGSVDTLNDLPRQRYSRSRRRIGRRPGCSSPPAPPPTWRAG